MIEIRKMGLGDAAAVANLTEQLGYPANVNKTLQRIKLMANMATNCIFVALANEQVVGWTHAFYTVRIESDPFVEIGGLVVDAAHRNKQIGKKLILQVIDWARETNVQMLKVRCNVIRTESHVFYERAGFNLSKSQKIFEMKILS